VVDWYYQQGGEEPEMFQVAIEETATREYVTSLEDATAIADELRVGIALANDEEDGVFLIDLPTIFEDIESFVIGRHTIYIEKI
jgi:hypothetical protein